jgi:hypothetical protein
MNITPKEFGASGHASKNIPKNVCAYDYEVWVPTLLRLLDGTLIACRVHPRDVSIRAGQIDPLRGSACIRVLMPLECIFQKNVIFFRRYMHDLTDDVEFLIPATSFSLKQSLSKKIDEEWENEWVMGTLLRTNPELFKELYGDPNDSGGDDDDSDDEGGDDDDDDDDDEDVGNSPSPPSIGKDISFPGNLDNES